MGNKIHSIYYHNPEPSGFEKMLKHYLRRGFKFISLGDLKAMIEGDIPFHKKRVFISFDDGWKGNLDLLPIIEKYNVPICIFVALEPLQSGNFWWEYVRNEIGLKKMLEFKKLPFSEFQRQLEGYRKRNVLTRSAITVEELKVLSEHPLVTIQSHTVNHPILTSLPEDVMDMELRESKMQLECLTGKEVYAFSYPNGSLNSREMDACRKYYRMAFTTEQRHISLGDELLLLPRVALTGDYCRDVLKIYGIWKMIRKICGK